MVEEDDGAREQDRPVVSRFFGVGEFSKFQSDKRVQKELLAQLGADDDLSGVGRPPWGPSRLF